MNDVNILGQDGVKLPLANPPHLKVAKNQSKTSLIYSVNRRMMVSADDNSAVKLFPDKRSELPKTELVKLSPNVGSDKNSSSPSLVGDQNISVNDVKNNSLIQNQNNEVKDTSTKVLIDNQNNEVKDTSTKVLINNQNNEVKDTSTKVLINNQNNEVKDVVNTNLISGSNSNSSSHLTKLGAVPNSNLNLMNNHTIIEEVNKVVLNQNKIDDKPIDNNLIKNQNKDLVSEVTHKVASNQNKSVFNIFSEKLIADANSPHSKSVDKSRVANMDTKGQLKNIGNKLIGSAIKGVDSALQRKFGDIYDTAKGLILDHEVFNPVALGLGVLGIKELSFSRFTDRLTTRMLGREKVKKIVKASDRVYSLSSNSQTITDYPLYLSARLGYSGELIGPMSTLWTRGVVLNNKSKNLSDIGSIEGNIKGLDTIYSITSKRTRMTLFDGTKWFVTMKKLGELTPEVPYSEYFSAGFQPAVDFKLTTLNYETDPIDLYSSEIVLPSLTKLNMDFEVTLVNDQDDTVNEYIRAYKKFMYGTYQFQSADNYNGRSSLLHVPSYRKLVTIINIYLFNPQGELRRSPYYNNIFGKDPGVNSDRPEYISMSNESSNDRDELKLNYRRFNNPSKIRNFVNYYSLLCIPKLNEESIQLNTSSRDNTVTIQYSVVGTTDYNLFSEDGNKPETVDIGRISELYISSNEVSRLKLGVSNLSKDRSVSKK